MISFHLRVILLGSLQYSSFEMSTQDLTLSAITCNFHLPFKLYKIIKLLVRSIIITSHFSFRQFQCQNGDCIKNDLVCDHNFDCNDKSDENHCFEQNQTSCSSVQFSCENGQCVSSNFLCDGHDDCGDSSDEKKCESKNCLESQFR